MNRAYDKTVWENFPSTASPLNAINLNKLSVAVETIDGRVIDNADAIEAANKRIDDIIAGGGGGDVTQKVSNENNLFPLLSSDLTTNTEHLGPAKQQSKLLGNPKTGVLQTAGGIEVTDASGYYALTKRRTASDGEVHRATVGVAENGATTIEHYPSESGAKDTRLEMAGGKIEAKVGTFWQNGVEVADKSYAPFRFGVDASGNYGYYPSGSSTVTPFDGGSSDSDGKVVQNPSSTNALYPMILSDKNDNTQHTGIVRTVAKAQVNPSTGAIQTAGGITITDDSGYYAFTKTRTVSSVQHKITFGASSTGAATLEHYPDASAGANTYDTRLEIASGKIEAKTGTFYQNGVEVADKKYVPFKLGKDSSGNYGYYKDGETTLTPFKTSSRNPTGNAAAGDVRASKTFSNTSSDGLTGNLTDSGGSTLTASSATVALSGTYARITPALSERIINASTKFNIPLTKFGDATASQVASGQTFTSSAGVAVAGTMTTFGDYRYHPNASLNLRSRSSYTDDYGNSQSLSQTTKFITVYEGATGYNGNASNELMILASRFGNATAADVAQGVTFTSENGIALTGTHQDSGGSAATGNATTSDVRSGKTFSNASGTGLSGGLVDSGGSTLTVSSATLALSGSYIQVTPALSERIINATTKFNVTASKFGDATASDVISGKKFTSKNGVNITGSYVPETGVSGTAKKSDVREGVTFSSVEIGGGATGELTDSSGETITASSATAALSGSYVQITPKLSERIIDASTKINIPASLFGNATAADVDSSSTFTSSAGVKIYGTMVQEYPVNSYNMSYIQYAKTSTTISVSSLSAAYYLLVVSDYVSSNASISLGTPTVTNGSIIETFTYSLTSGRATKAFLIQITSSSTGSVSFTRPARSSLTDSQWRCFNFHLFKLSS